MILTLVRMRQTRKSTLGTLICGDFECFTLEDPWRAHKEAGITRIPAGTYRITLRDEGGMTEKYRTTYGADFHKGMLWLRDVPNFEYVYIHTGNTPEDTRGCILVGQVAEGKDRIGLSRDAYKKLYPIVRDAIERGEEVLIEISDENDRG